MTAVEARAFFSNMVPGGLGETEPRNFAHFQKTATNQIKMSTMFKKKKKVTLHYVTLQWKSTELQEFIARY